MQNFFDIQKARLVDSLPALQETGQVSQGFEEAFWQLIDQVNLYLIQETDPFYSYFFFQMERVIRLDITTPTGVYFKGATYKLAFNPFLYLNLTLEQMASCIQHESHHILAKHLIRGRAYEAHYSALAISMAMDLVVNQHLNYLPPYASTLERVKRVYQLKLNPYEPFEYYIEKLQLAFDLMDLDDEGEADDTKEDLAIETAYNQALAHDLWEESEMIDEETLAALTEGMIREAQKGPMAAYLEGMLKAFLKDKEEESWQLYLKRLAG